MKLRRLFAMVAALSLLLGACTDDDDSAVETGAPTTAADDDGGGEAEPIQISGNEYAFEVDSTLEGGFVEVEFSNEGKLKHEAGFIKIEGTKTEADFIKEFKAVCCAEEEGAPIPAYLKPHSGNSEADAGDDAEWGQSLPAGSYFLVCALTDADSQKQEEAEGEEGEDTPALPPHFEQGMIEKVTVTGPSTVTPPEGDATVSASEYTFEIDGIKSGSNDVVFKNDGPKEIHMAAAFEFPEGVDEAAAQKALEAFSGEGPPPAGTPEPDDVGFSGIFEPGGSGTFELDAKAGRVYAFICFIQDRAGGPPHIAKGMAKLLTVK